MKRSIIGLIAAVAIMCTAAASATPILTLGDITGNALHTETASGDQRFRLTDNSGILDDATAFLMFEFAGNADYNSFGIYSGANSLEVFGGSTSPLSAATLGWNTITNNVTLIGSGNSAIIDNTDFGFYIDTRSDGRFFSESALNGGYDYMKAFNVGASGHSDLLGANMVLAFEDLAYNHTDWDYNDMVVGISDIGPTGPSIQQVSEPGILGMMGLGLVGLAGIKRNRRKMEAMRK